LEKEKSQTLEEIGQLREVTELSEKAKNLENEVNKLRDEVKVLKDKIPPELLQELSCFAPQLLKEEEKTQNEERSGCDEEDFL